MKTYKEALEITAIAIRQDGGDYRTAYRYGALSTLANIYGHDLNTVYRDINVLDVELEKEQKARRKESMCRANEARRLANIEAGGKLNREPKQRRMDLGA